MSNSFLSNQEFNNSIELSILMPCLNEAETIAVCIEKAHSFLKVNKIIGEVVIADNGSTDGSQRIAEANGARVIHVKERGYGSALIDGIKATYGKYIIMGDADDSYDFTALTPFVEKLREGYDLVMGNRFRGGIKPGAMPPLHRYLGNPVLSGIGRLFFPSAIGDFHCGLRGFNREAMIKLNLKPPVWNLPVKWWLSQRYINFVSLRCQPLYPRMAVHGHLIFGAGEMGGVICVFC